MHMRRYIVYNSGAATPGGGGALGRGVPGPSRPLACFDAKRFFAQAPTRFGPDRAQSQGTSAALCTATEPRLDAETLA